MEGGVQPLFKLQKGDMITTFFSMLYLAFTLVLTMITIRIIFNLDRKPKQDDTYYVFVTCFLWAIWYFYFIN